IEAVARLALPRRRAVAEHPRGVRLDGVMQRTLTRRTRGTHRGQNAAAGLVELLVPRTACAQRELLDAVAGERRMRVAVDEAWERAETAAVELVDLALETRQVGHRPRRRDASVHAEHERSLDQVRGAERVAAERRVPPGRRDEPREVTDEETGHRRRSYEARAPPRQPSTQDRRAAGVVV